MPYILAIDQGTTSSRAILFDEKLKPISTAQKEFPQHYPKSGWVEHDPEDLWSSVLFTAEQAIKNAGKTGRDIAVIGITNQRETTIVWDRKTGAPIHKAIVWQDRRTAAFCHQLQAAGHGDTIAAKTGLLLDPYFSASKIRWLLDNVEGARAKAEAGDLAFGTVDSWLIWNLTGGKKHLTDATNAARSMLYNIKENQWDAELCALFDVPMSLLPEVRDCADDFGKTAVELFGSEIAILGVAGDQQAATIGQACFTPGAMKATYGTGCFALLNTGNKMIISKNRLLTTIAYRIDGRTTYALEGSIFIAGAVVQWLRDGMQIIKEAKATNDLALAADPDQNVIIVPAFTGLGAPYWEPECRGAIYGLTRNSGPKEIARAALESVAYQTRDLLEAMRADWNEKLQVLRVDGGMSGNDWAMQFLSDLIGAAVDRPKIIETTALGAAYLAGYRAGILPSPEDFSDNWAMEKRFTPDMSQKTRDLLYHRWRRAVEATILASKI